VARQPACLYRPLALAAALRLALVPFPPACLECQEVPVAGASPPARHPLSAHLGAPQAEAVPVCQEERWVVEGRGHALSPEWACHVALPGATEVVGLELPGQGHQGRGAASSQRYGCKSFPLSSGYSGQIGIQGQGQASSSGPGNMCWAAFPGGPDS
jgi:hypothetical protein